MSIARKTERVKEARRRERNPNRTKEWFAKNPNYQSQWVKRNPEKAKAKFKKYYEANKEKKKAYLKKWLLANPEKASFYGQTRRAAKLNATPMWADFDLIFEIYFQAKSCGMVVDHIVPLQSKFVCGLHVHSNMQLLTAVENSRKSNRYWPDMFDV